MRNPLRKAGYWLVLGLTGVAGLLLAIYGRDRLGELASGIAGGVGVTLIAVSLVWGTMSLLAAIGYARLRAGIGVIAHWHLTPAEWDRFRAFDAIRAAQHESLVNDLWIRKRTPANGVDVIVGRRQLIVDGSYNPLRRHGIPGLTGVNWLPAPADPECLEFKLAYPRGRYGGIRYLALRVPVAPSAREDGVRVFWHFHALVPEQKEALAFRRPRLVIGGGLAVALVAALAGGIGWLMHSRGDQSEATMILMLSGIMGTIGALFFTAVIALVTQPWKQKH